MSRRRSSSSNRKRMEKAGKQRKENKRKNNERHGLFGNGFSDGASDALLDEGEHLWTVPARRFAPEMASSGIRSWKGFEAAWTDIWLDSCVCTTMPVEIVSSGERSRAEFAFVWSRRILGLRMLVFLC